MVTIYASYHIAASLALVWGDWHELTSDPSHERNLPNTLLKKTSKTLFIVSDVFERLLHLDPHSCFLGMKIRGLLAWDGENHLIFLKLLYFWVCPDSSSNQHDPFRNKTTQKSPQSLSSHARSGSNSSPKNRRRFVKGVTKGGRCVSLEFEMFVSCSTKQLT